MVKARGVKETTEPTNLGSKDLYGLNQQPESLHGTDLALCMHVTIVEFDHPEGLLTVGGRDCLCLYYLPLRPFLPTGLALSGSV